MSVCVWGGALMSVFWSVGGSPTGAVRMTQKRGIGTAKIIFGPASGSSRVAFVSWVRMVSERILVLLVWQRNIEGVVRAGKCYPCKRSIQLWGGHNISRYSPSTLLSQQSLPLPLPFYSSSPKTNLCLSSNPNHLPLHPSSLLTLFFPSVQLPQTNMTILWNSEKIFYQHPPFFFRRWKNSENILSRIVFV